LDAVFDAFVQTESGRKSQQGTGLGLPISRQFVHLMGGELTVSTPPPPLPGEGQVKGGPGSVFQFDVQIATVPRSEIETLRQESKSASRVVGLEPGQCAADGSPYRLLVVDDIAASRDLLTKLLSSFGPPPRGFDVRSATNGREAIEIWREWKPHLIWMDIRMPVMDGHEAIQHIHATPQRQDTIVVALTASAFEEERTIALSEGYDDFIRKPFRETEIFDRLTRHLGVRFFYQDSERAEVERAISPSEVLTPAALAALPADWVADLERAALLGDLGSILDLIEQIRRSDAVLEANVAAALVELAQNFKYDEILAWLAR
jgi:CheY-like chemotaxis protein